MPWKDNIWIDDDGSLTVGTPFDAEHMNNIELGIAEDQAGVAAASGMAGSALIQAASGVAAAGSALITGQQANVRAASGVAAAGSALVTGQFAGALAGSALTTGQKANALAASGVAAAGSGVTGVTNLLNLLATTGVEAVFHGTDSNAKRPSGVKSVIWIGTVEPLNAAELDPWINPEDFGINSSVFTPSCRVYASGQQSIPSAVVTPLTFNSERWDNAGIHSTVTNTGRLVAPKSGVYSVGGYLAWEGAEIGTTTFFLAIRVNGVTVYGANWCPPSFQSEHEVHSEVFLEAGDYVELLTYQGSGKAVKTAAAAGSNLPNGAEMTMTWMGTGTPSLTPVNWGLVTELPAGAGVGDTCELKVRETEASPWKVWECVKVESSGESPWAKKGGPALLAKTSPGTSSASAYGTTGIPKLTYPANGDYLVTFGADKSIRNNIATDSGFLRTAYFSNGSQIEENIGRLGGNGAETMSTEISHTARVKGQQADARFKNDGGNSTVWEGLFIKIDATRLG